LVGVRLGPRPGLLWPATHRSPMVNNLSSIHRVYRGSRSGPRRQYAQRKVILHCFNVDDFGVPWAEAAQFMACRSGIAFLVEKLLPLMIGRPSAVAADIPVGDPRVGFGSARLRSEHQRRKQIVETEVNQGMGEARPQARCMLRAYGAS